jgi:hypothetical protein
MQQMQNGIPKSPIKYPQKLQMLIINDWSSDRPDVLSGDVHTDAPGSPRCGPFQGEEEVGGGVATEGREIAEGGMGENEE